MDWNIVIQARVGSTRLPQKMLMPFVEGKSILQIIIENLLYTFPKDKIIVATSTSPADEQIKSVVSNYGIKVFKGDENNVLKRFVDCCEMYNVKNIIRLCADNPFLVPNYIKMLVENVTNTDNYLSFSFPDGTPTIKSHIGLFTEFTTISTLKQVIQFTNEQLYTEHVTNYIYANPSKFNVRFLPLPNELQNRNNIRLTIDTKDDFDLLSDLYQKLPSVNSPDFVKSLLLLIDNHPEIKQRMLMQINRNAK